MSTTTPNYGLVLPDGSENVSRTVINNNMTAIDSAIKAANDHVDDAWVELKSLITWRDGSGAIALDPATTYNARMKRLGKTRHLAIQLITAGAQAFGSG